MKRYEKVFNDTRWVRRCSIDAILREQGAAYLINEYNNERELIYNLSYTKEDLKSISKSFIFLFTKMESEGRYDIYTTKCTNYSYLLSVYKVSFKDCDGYGFKCIIRIYNSTSFYDKRLEELKLEFLENVS
jgi:hypothetical protein